MPGAARNKYVPPGFWEIAIPHLTTDELIDYTNGERKKWLQWLVANPEAMNAPAQRQGRFLSVGSLIDHIFLVTGLSSGSVSAFAGGARDIWESGLFGGVYHTEGVTGLERPKYGALELVRHPDGPIPRFGSCYFVLRSTVSMRTSFTFMGSEDPRARERLGTIDQMHNVMGALLAEIEEGAMAAPPWPPFRAPTLGVPNLTVARLLDILREQVQSVHIPARTPAGEDVTGEVS